MRTLSFDGETGLAINKVGDSSTLVIVSDLEALRQKVRQRLRFFLGEWFLNTTDGLPYFQQIFTKLIDPSLVVSLINQEVSKEEDVTTIKGVSAKLDVTTRKLSYNFTMETTFGTEEMNDTFINN